MRYRTAFWLAVCFYLAGLADGAGLQGPQAVDLTIRPAQAEVGILYSGVELVVSAEVDLGVEIAVLLTAPNSELHMRKMERVWGLFWAPSHDVTFENVPGLYLLRTSSELTELAPEAVLGELGLGYEALRYSIEDGSGDDSFPELVRLRESEGLFSSSAVAAHREGGPGRECQEIGLALNIPATAPATTYRVQLFGFRGGQLVARGEGAFELRQAGVISFLSSLALEHGLVYGFLAVVLALAAGLGVGFLCGSAQKH